MRVAVEGPDLSYMYTTTFFGEEVLEGTLRVSQPLYQSLDLAANFLYAEATKRLVLL